jgi:DNA gyrase subunit A
VRVFKGRDSSGVRGIDLREGDAVIGMAILHHTDSSPAEAREFLRQEAMKRRARGEEGEAEAAEPEEADEEGVVSLTPERLAELGARQQFVLTVTSDGLGKRASSYEYRVTGRGGKGLIAHRLSDENASVVASFPVDDSQEILLVTDAGQLIRLPVDGIRMAGRATQGVILINTGEGERVVAAERLEDVGDGE